MEAKTMKALETAEGGAHEAFGLIASSANYSRPSRSLGKPSWLLFTIADLDERMKALAINIPEEKDAADSFAERAESYYHRRPQLLSLLQDLYNGYVLLADRYCQALAKTQHHRRYSSPITPFQFDQFEDEDTGDVIDSDAESSLSYQLPLPPPHAGPDVDMIIADLVIKSVDYEIVLNELSIVERRQGESSRKIDLQKSLLDVLESERLILLDENARLGYRMNTLIQENKALASESLFMKRKASELARCVLQMREDHRVCMLSRKIEDLQGQIYGLEKRNREYYEQLVRQEEEIKCRAKKVGTRSGKEVTLDDCYQVYEDGPGVRFGSCNSDNVKKSTQVAPGVMGRGKKVAKLWDRVKKFDQFFCGPHLDYTC